MDAVKKLTLLLSATLVALALVASPALAQEEEVPVGDPGAEEAEEVEEPAAEEEEGGRAAIAETPRDRLGLLLLISLLVGGGIALANGRRQLKGDHPQATGEFRWR